MGSCAVLIRSLLSREWVFSEEWWVPQRMLTVPQKLFLYKLSVGVERCARLVGRPSVMTHASGTRASLVFNRPRFLNCIDDTVINPTAAFLAGLSSNKEKMEQGREPKKKRAMS